MTNLPYLTLLILLPLVGSLVTFTLPMAFGAARIKAVAIGFSVASFFMFVLTALQFELGTSDKFQLTENYEWIAAFGVSWAVGVDGLGLVMLGLVAILVPVVLLAGWSDIADDVAGKFFGLVLLLQAVVTGVFAATDLFMFYVFFEVMLIPMYFLIGRFGDQNRRKAAVKFLIFSLVGGLVLLAGVISVWVNSIRITGFGSFDLEYLSSLDLSL